MTDRNCWTCRYNMSNRSCEFDTPDDDLAISVDEWCGDNVSANTLMPPRETTPCPGYEATND